MAGPIIGRMWAADPFYGWRTQDWIECEFILFGMFGTCPAESTLSATGRHPRYAIIVGIVCVHVIYIEKNDPSQTKDESNRNKGFICRINYQKLFNHQCNPRNVHQIII